MADEELERTDLLRRADSAWVEWRRFLDREEANGRGGVTGADGWTLAEAVAHVANWQAATSERIRRLLARDHLDKLDIDAQNAEWAVIDRGVAFAAASERLDASWLGLRKLAEEIPGEKWRRLAPAIAANTWEHYEEHMAWRPAAPPPPPPA